MAIPVQVQYIADQEERVRGFYQTLSEKDRRRYAALEARRLGRGGHPVCRGGRGVFAADD